MTQPRKVRKREYAAPKHIVRKRIAAHLSDELYSRYGTRSFTIIKGDFVKVIRGASKGVEGKVSMVNTKKRKVAIEGLTTSKADKKQVPYFISPSNLIITRLELKDKKRVERLRKIAEIKRIEAFAEPEVETPKDGDKSE